ncbi:(-)-isopiperitenol/(-)-carveol dehydrogenase, mitochondrial-like [Eucalyptus grandis]|uniref:(-)-isopiperitenol/(-)-carveol dehydrogenase, mitochondrial-like n=1 Tax=Eucalyptus grandis TaxID=71139 RepID=UPI00192EC2C0|nr:(-)-isopiperitenol/(-)-carveol dehydrogenase, mitochondrial-like [Eucalyptus grandis]
MMGPFLASFVCYQPSESLAVAGIFRYEDDDNSKVILKLMVKFIISSQPFHSKETIILKVPGLRAKSADGLAKYLLGTIGSTSPSARLHRPFLYSVFHSLLAEMASHASNKLDGKVAIITGGASGIGEETARRLAYHGAYVVIADIQDKKGHNLVASIGSHRCTYIHCDVTDEQQVKFLVESTLRSNGHLDILFSNAGTVNDVKQDILEFNIPAFERLFAVNVRGMAACVKHGARAMVAGAIKGNIICTASIRASTGNENYVDYVMSKHAVLGLVRSASKQLGAYGIRVNCVSPGAVATPLLCQAFGVSEEEGERMYESHSCLKGVLKAKHVADAVVFLASEEAEFINGHDLAVDGGWI